MVASREHGDHGLAGLGIPVAQDELLGLEPVDEGRRVRRRDDPGPPGRLPHPVRKNVQGLGVQAVVDLLDDGESRGSGSWRAVRSASMRTAPKEASASSIGPASPVARRSCSYPPCRSTAVGMSVRAVSLTS